MNDHDHRGEYADTRHDHFGEYAEEQHRHYDLEHDDKAAEREIQGFREDVRDLRAQLADALDRLRALEADTPQARQLQLEADQAAADLASSGYDRHGRDCQCPYCSTDDDPEAAEPDLAAPFPIVPAGSIAAQVAADVRRLTGTDPS